MKKLPGIVQAEINHLLKQGYSKAQAKQLGWVEFWEAQSSSWLNSGRRHHVYCKTCGKGNDFVAAGSVRDFIVRCHNGHNTTYFAK